ncbi:MAG: hypothetical protein HY049_05820 [Acidobacteria bacterium]|nr:hypothetical protein [Acidobacteriota bacterium]
MTRPPGTRGGPGWAALLLVALPWGLAGAIAAEAPAPLNDEDVVRMLASGMSEARILERVREAPGQYDLSPEMLAELKQAGLSDAILDAMRRKPARPAAVPPAATTPAAMGFIEIFFDDDPKRSAAENSVVAPAVAHGDAQRSETPVELAFAVTCSQPAHVPDQWHTLSPFGASPGRHEVLFFEASTAQVAERHKGGPLVYLPHPPRWRFPAGAGHHRGLLIVAARLAGDPKYTLMAAESYDDLDVKEGQVTRLDLRIRSERPRGGGDSAHPVTSNPGLTNIGSTAETIGLWPVTIKLLQAHPPEPEASAGAAAPARPQSQRR